ncbi:MAG: lamin tail domain-containing protein, partial [Pirellulaceae bacterium]|nr:lamin tail domain-containing protein [Pirellulaceae bacterium]
MMFRRRRRASAKKLHICSNRELSVESLEPRRVLDSTVVINEIMYNPAGPNDGLGEWIELYNQLRVDMDISEWQLRGAVDFDIPDGTVVPGNGHLVIAANPEAFEQSTGVVALGPWEGFLSNGGEEIRLYNNDRRVMNRVDYD